MTTAETASPPTAPIPFSGAQLDRADALRARPEALARLMAEGARVMALDGLDPVIGADGAVQWLPLSPDAPGEIVFLGLDAAGQGHFVPVPAPEQAETGPARPELWQRLAGMSAAGMAEYGIARALAGWHARHRFCARCGGPTTLARGGWQRDCGACHAQHFPRTDPVVIMTVEHEGRLLLGRQPRFPAGRYSALAGFIEPGESLEEAVRREIHEEAGLLAHSVRYVASQPWPFPSSLMLGCHALTDDPTIHLDANELEDARWFTRDELAAAMRAAAAGDAGHFPGVPDRRAIAWHLIDWWLRR